MKQKNFWRNHKIPPKTKHHRIFKILENIQKSRGFQNEERFMRAIENGNGNNPDWYNGISKATMDQDQKGIDFIIHTAFGDIFVQIKSSEAGAKKFLNKLRTNNFRIVVLIIKRDYNEENIRSISFTAIQAEIDFFKKPSC